MAAQAPTATHATVEVNPAIGSKAAEIAAAKAALTQTQSEIGVVSDRLASLRKHEQSLQDNLMKLSSEHRTLMNFDTTARAKTIETQVQNDEDQMRNLQRQIETIERRRQAALEELEAVCKVGDTAGEKQSRNQHNLITGRFDMRADDVMSGGSHDTLAQTPARITGQSYGHSRPTNREGLAPSINDLGNHVAASPYVNPDDYKIIGERPKTAAASAKFSDWRSPSRNSTRVAQPPGGFSHMSSIFG